MRKEMGKWDLDRVKESCLCTSCTSYVDCGEKGFCYPSAGKSKCIKEEKGCLCPGCPVQAAMDYDHVYYCNRGSHREQGAGR